MVTINEIELAREEELSDIQESSDVDHDETSNRTHDGDDLEPETVEVQRELRARDEIGMTDKDVGTFNGVSFRYTGNRLRKWYILSGSLQDYYEENWETTGGDNIIGVDSDGFYIQSNINFDDELNGADIQGASQGQILELDGDGNFQVANPPSGNGGGSITDAYFHGGLG